MKKSLIAIALVLSAFSARAEVDRYFMSTRPRFTWGTAVGTSIDMTGNDMASMDVSLNVGMRKGWINFLGVGAEACFAVSNSCRFFPVYVHFQTNFTNRPTIAFWDLKLGGSFNSLEGDINQSALYAYTGVGFNLARSAKFATHLSVGYTFRQRRNLRYADRLEVLDDLHCATVKIGVEF